MKRYILLAGDRYYPEGWNDFKGYFDSIEEAESIGDVLVSMGGGCDWFEVADTEADTAYPSKMIVSQGNRVR